MTTPKTPAAALLALACLLACDYAPRGRCASQSDCLAGQICANGVCSAKATGPMNLAPIAAADAYGVARDTILQVAAPGVLANDSDPDGDALTAEKVADPTHGTVYLAPDGSFVYVPAAGYTGDDVFTYRASDGVLRSDVAAVTVTVGP